MVWDSPQFLVGRNAWSSQTQWWTTVPVKGLSSHTCSPTGSGSSPSRCPTGTAKLSLRAHLFPSGTLSLEKTRTDVIAALASQSAQPRAVQSEREAHCSFPLSLQLGRSIGRHGNQPSNQRQALPCLSQRTTHPPTPAWLCKVPHPGPGGRGREAESRGQGVGTPSGVPCPKPPKLG